MSTIFKLLFVFVSFTGVAQSLTDKLPVDPNVKTGKLANGLTYYIRHNTKPEKKAELRLVINAGSILEDDNQQGLAHFTEHMAFNGSKNFKKNELVSYLQSIGVEFGADLNAYTSFDETVYILPIPTEKKDIVEKGFQILGDWAGYVAFNKAEIDKERGVILEELRNHKGANERMSKVTLPEVFANSKYASRLPGGQEQILKTFKPETIKQFYKDWYRPDLMAVAVVGDIDVPDAEALIKKYFGALKNLKAPRPRTYVGIPGRRQSHGLVVTDKEATQAQLQVYYSNTEARESVTIGDYRRSIVERLFTSMLSQRLQELTQSANPPFLYAGSSLGPFVRGYEGYSAFAMLGKGGAEPALTAIVQEHERARQFGFTQPELDRTKKMFMKSIERAYNERDKLESAALVNEYVRNFLEHESMPGIENEYTYYKKYLEGITLPEVDEIAARLIPAAGDPKLIVYTGPSAELSPVAIPTGDELVSMMEAAARTQLKPYEEKRVASALMESKPQAGTIVSQTQHATLGTVELLLSNGVRVILKPTDFKNDQVVMNASRAGGYYSYDIADRTNAEYASSVISTMGVARFSPVDLRKVLAGKTAGVSLRINPTSETVSGSSSAADLETMLQLTYLNFTQPRLDQELFNSFVTRQQAAYQNLAADPQAVFQDSLYRYVYGRQPWAPRLPAPAIFADINVNRVVEIHRERFGDASGFTFVIVGAFDINSIQPLLATYLGSLPSTKGNSSFKDVGLRPAGSLLKKEVRRGTEPKSLAVILWNGEAPYSPDEAFRLAALVEVVNLRLTEALREEMGGVYSPGISGALNKIPYGNYSVGINIPCAPENVDKLIARALAEVDKIRANGPLSADLDKVKETWKQQHKVQLQDNSYWSRYLLQAVELGYPADRVLSFQARVDALRPADLKAAANRYLDTKKYIQVVLNPEK